MALQKKLLRTAARAVSGRVTTRELRARAAERWRTNDHAPVRAESGPHVSGLALVVLAGAALALPLGFLLGRKLREG